jgi:hypothetical protein
MWPLSRYATIIIVGPHWQPQAEAGPRCQDAGPTLSPSPPPSAGTSIGHVRPHFFEIDVGFPVSSVDLFGRHRRRPVLVSGVHANFLTHVSAKAAPTALTCEDCGVRFISRLEYKIQAWRHVYVCIRLYHGECDISNPARGHTVLPEKLLIRPLVEKGQ